MRAAVAADPTYPRLLFVHLGTVEDGEAFFANAWPEAQAISDSDKTLYKAFGLQRAGLKETMSPGVMACGLRATLKGHMNGKPNADPWQMPGLFLVQGSKILWQHDFAHVGDHPDWSKIPQMATIAASA